MNPATTIPHPDLMEPASFPRGRPAFPRTVRGRREMLEHLALPYGMWEQPDGRAVVFNRHYDPIYILGPDGSAVPVAGGWAREVDRAATSYFFGDGTAPWHRPREHERAYRLAEALAAAALATGYGQPAPIPDLVGWLRERGEPLDPPACQVATEMAADRVALVTAPEPAPAAGSRPRACADG